MIDPVIPIVLQAGDVSMRLSLLPTEDAYAVEVFFTLDALKLHLSKWANPMRTALEAADEALNELKCSCFNEELNSCRKYLKQEAEKPV